MNQSKVLVAGTGISGIAAAKLVLERGGEVVLYDGNTALNTDEIRAKFGKDAKVGIVLGEIKRSDLLGVELCIISPGIPLNSGFVAVVDEAGIPVLGEIELAYQCGLGKLAAITGTNGKTTTTALTGAILRSQYEETFVVGNIGEPYTSKVSEMTDQSVTVAEVSSFQLETIMDFHPDVSAILNITPDHLDRHGSMENYIRIKECITMNQTAKDAVVLNYDDPVLREFGESRIEEPEPAEDAADTDAGWAWDASSQTLTVENLSLTVPQGKLEERAAIYLPDESTVRVKGSNNSLNTLSYHCNGIYCEGELTFEGKGKLKIVTDSYSASAIYAKQGPVTFYDSVEIAADPDGHVIYIEKAKGKNPIISVQDDAKVTFPKDNANKNSILVTKNSSTKQGENWFDYAEAYDEFDDTIELVAKNKVKKDDKTDDSKKDETKTDETKTDETKTTNTYQLTIGKADILKNGAVSHTADVAPYIKNGYTMLPLRALLAVSNPAQEVKWSATENAAYTFVNDKLTMLTPNAATYKKGTETIQLSTPAELKDGRLFVSLRDWMSIMEIEGTQLDWNSTTKTVTLRY